MHLQADDFKSGGFLEKRWLNWYFPDALMLHTIDNHGVDFFSGAGLLRFNRLFLLDLKVGEDRLYISERYAPFGIVFYSRFKGFDYQGFPVFLRQLFNARNKGFRRVFPHIHNRLQKGAADAATNNIFHGIIIIIIISGCWMVAGWLLDG